MAWNDIKDIAAVWGAFLSTWLLIRSWWQTRPLIMIDCVAEKMGRNPLRIRIENVGNFPIHIKKIRPWLGGQLNAAIVNAYVDGWELKDVIRSAVERHLDIVVPSQGEAVLRLYDDSDSPEAMLLSVHWYQHSSFIFPSFPRLIYRSKQQLLDLRKHPLSEHPKKETH